MKCLKTASNFGFLKSRSSIKISTFSLFWPLCCLSLQQSCFIVNCTMLVSRKEYNKFEPDHLLLKASWNLYYACCRHSHDLKISSGLWILLLLRDYSFFLITVILLVPLLRADGAFKVEDNPFLELGQRFAMWDGIAILLITHTEHSVFLGGMNTG